MKRNAKLFSVLLACAVVVNTVGINTAYAAPNNEILVENIVIEETEGIGIDEGTVEVQVAESIDEINVLDDTNVSDEIIVSEEALASDEVIISEATENTVEIDVESEVEALTEAEVELEAETGTDVEATSDNNQDNAIATVQEVANDISIDNVLTDETYYTSDMPLGELPLIYDIDYDGIDELAEGASIHALDYIDGAGETFQAKYIPSFKSDIPAVRNQGNTSTCWAHASIVMAEMSMIKKGKANRSVDYSELALAYFFSHPQVDPLGGTVGDINKRGGNSDWIKSGGNVVYSTEELASWIGAANDADDAAFSNWQSVYASDSLDPSYAYSKDVAHLTGAKFFDIAYYTETGTSATPNTDEYMELNRNAAKKYILENGIICASFYVPDSDEEVSLGVAYTSANNCFYYPKVKGTNHAISIVGWDDDFPKENFANSAAAGYGLPKANGAWLIRNSWDTTEHDTEDGYYNLDQYFWMSYYDMSLRNSRSLIFDSSDNYDNNYQYDGGFVSNSIYMQDEITIANVFEAKASNVGEYVKAVMFETSSSNVKYTIEIYKDPDTDDPTTGTKVLTSTTRGTTDFPGVYTVDLANPVYVSNGHKFAAVVTLEKAGSQVKVPYEADTRSTDWIYSQVSAEPGQSYVLEGDWTDFGDEYGANLRIKAFTKNAVADHYIKYDANGGTGTIADQPVVASEDIYLSDGVFTRKGYDFVGWNTKADGSGELYAENSVVSDLVFTEDTLTLYATWDAVDYSIKYNLNGGKNNSKNPTTYNVLSGNISLKNPTKSGYTFKGWYTDRSLTKKITTIKAGTVGNISLYAKWAAYKKYNIVFNGNGSNGGRMPAMKRCKVGVKYTLTPNAYYKNGYEFTGWNTEKDGSGTSYKDGAKVSNLGGPNGGNIKLYAQWKKSSGYKITYVLSGGTNNPKNPSSYVGDRNVKLYKPTREGYRFDGWYIDYTYDHRINTINRGMKGNLVLFAHWVPVSYTVLYVSGDFYSKLDGYQTQVYDEEYTIGENVKNSNIYFWSTKKDGTGKIYYKGQKVSNLSDKYGDIIVLYPIYTGEPITILK